MKKPTTSLWEEMPKADRKGDQKPMSRDLAKAENKEEKSHLSALHSE